METPLKTVSKSGSDRTHKNRQRRIPPIASAPLSLHETMANNSTMSLELFVATKFIPEHVETKRAAGRRHYYAILKHVLQPEKIDRLLEVVRLRKGHELLGRIEDAKIALSGQERAEIALAELAAGLSLEIAVAQFDLAQVMLGHEGHKRLDRADIEGPWGLAPFRLAGLVGFLRRRGVVFSWGLAAPSHV